VYGNQKLAGGLCIELRREARAGKKTLGDLKVAPTKAEIDVNLMAYG
jgi:hypothetical protein